MMDFKPDLKIQFVMPFLKQKSVVAFSIKLKFYGEKQNNMGFAQEKKLNIQKYYYLF